MREFQREDRYIVIKRSDLKKVPVSYRSHLVDPMFSLLGHLPRRECVVVESDWPEYHLVWAMLEHRMAGKPVPDFNLWRRADELQQRLADAEKKLNPVDGDLLPAVGSKVFIHLARSDSWAEHTVVGYYAWDNHGLDKNVHRIFVRVRDSQGYLNARLLNDIRLASPGCADGDQPS